MFAPLLIAAVIAAEPAAPGEVTPPAQRSFGVHVALNVGLIGVELQHDHFYGFVDGNIGVPLLSRGSQIAFAVAAGLTHAIPAPAASMWFFDVFGLVNPGASTRVGYVGFGLGLGLRYLHASGFTVGLRLPIFGAAVIDPKVGRTFGTAVELFYGANLIALPILSVGWRF